MTYFVLQSVATCWGPWQEHLISFSEAKNLLSDLRNLLNSFLLGNDLFAKIIFFNSFCGSSCCCLVLFISLLFTLLVPSSNGFFKVASLSSMIAFELLLFSYESFMDVISSLRCSHNLLFSFNFLPFGIISDSNLSHCTSFFFSWLFITSSILHASSSFVLTLIISFLYSCSLSWGKYKWKVSWTSSYQSISI